MKKATRNRRRQTNGPRKREIVNTLFLILISSTLFSLFITSVYSIPEGPTVTILGNTTKSTVDPQLVNSTVNGSTPGGFIFTMGLTALQQNSRWKAYVGNVSGTLTLDDANGNTLFQWSLASVSGEVYATRASGSINWTGINCTWIADGKVDRTDGLDNSNRSPEHDENIFLSHTSSDDNVSATFNTRNHSQMDIGGRIIGKNECFSVNTYQGDATQVFTDSDDANFTQIVLYDGALNSSDGNLVYATEIEQDITAYNSAETYDFQMILPEDGGSGFSSSTGYYFYVELT